eukprot:3550401-Prymnesium_polylepis.1
MERPDAATIRKPKRTVVASPDGRATVRLCSATLDGSAAVRLCNARRGGVLISTRAGCQTRALGTTRAASEMTPPACTVCELRLAADEPSHARSRTIAEPVAGALRRKTLTLTLPLGMVDALGFARGVTSTRSMLGPCAGSTCSETVRRRPPY